MAKFTYVARDSSGAAISGDLVAGNPTDAARLLRAEGKFLVRIQEASSRAEASPSGGGRKRVKTDEVIFFANQLAGMVDTGVPIADALEATIDQSPPGAFRSTVEDLIRRVQGGSDFSAALASHPKVFPPLFIHMIRASESTGMLGPMLRRVADYLTSQREVVKKVRGAMIYPCCLLTFALGAVIFLLTMVIPKFAGIYAGKQAILPLPTRILMTTSDWMIAHWWHLLVGAAILVSGLIVYRRTPHGRYTADWLKLNAPVIGTMFRKACLARALRTLGAMITAGVSVLEAVLITRDVVDNRPFGEIFESAHRKLEHGEQLSGALLDAPYLPRPVWQMIRAGERSGQVGPVMDRVADLCESDLQHTIRSLTQFIEPVMIVVMGLVIGGIALAVLLPVFQMSKIMAH
ncbi:MAG: pilus assembly protein PilC [Phycisphaerae bacterium]